MHQVTINAVLNGWIVKVGCQTLVTTDEDELIKHLGEYLKDPKKKMESFLKTAKNKYLWDSQPQPLPTPMSERCPAEPPTPYPLGGAQLNQAAPATGMPGR